jgi:cytochrome P450 family 26 subfamily A
VALSDEDIVDNVLVIMIAGYDTSFILLTLLILIGLSANNRSVYANICQGMKRATTHLNQDWLTFYKAINVSKIWHCWKRKQNKVCKNNGTLALARSLAQTQ